MTEQKNMSVPQLNTRCYHLLVLITSADVWLEADPVHCWIPHAAVVQLHWDLGSDATVLTNSWATLHFLPHCKVLRHRCITQTHSNSSSHFTTSPQL